MKILMYVAAAVLIAFASGYLCGVNSAAEKTKKVETEVIKHAAQKRAVIQARPNADRDELLELMRANRL